MNLYNKSFKRNYEIYNFKEIIFILKILTL